MPLATDNPPALRALSDTVKSSEPRHVSIWNSSGPNLPAQRIFIVAGVGNIESRSTEHAAYRTLIPRIHAQLQQPIRQHLADIAGVVGLAFPNVFVPLRVLYLVTQPGSVIATREKLVISPVDLLYPKSRIVGALRQFPRRLIGDVAD